MKRLVLLLALTLTWSGLADVINDSPVTADQGTYYEVVASQADGDGDMILEDEPEEPEEPENSPVDGFVKIDGSEREQVIDGNGQSFEINGAENKITIRGKSGAVIVNGAENQVHADEPSRIEVSGYGNTVTYSRGAPSVEQSGMNISVFKK
jgi:hypothetical protein